VHDAGLDEKLTLAQEASSPDNYSRRRSFQPMDDLTPEQQVEALRLIDAGSFQQIDDDDDDDDAMACRNIADAIASRNHASATADGSTIVAISAEGMADLATDLPHKMRARILQRQRSGQCSTVRRIPCVGARSPHHQIRLPCVLLWSRANLPRTRSHATPRHATLAHAPPFTLRPGRCAFGAQARELVV